MNNDQDNNEQYQSANEKLFLLEFIVDQVTFNFCTTRTMSELEGQTCVSMLFLNNGPFNICEGDFSNTTDYTQNVVIKNGKSCVFALTQDQIEDVASNLTIDADVFKFKTNERDSDKVAVGKAVIHIGCLFDELMAKSQNQETPVVSKTYKDSFSIISLPKNENVGSLSVYIRMSCFGKNIVNQFQMNTQDQCVDLQACIACPPRQCCPQPPPSDPCPPRPCCSQVPPGFPLPCKFPPKPCSCQQASIDIQTEDSTPDKKGKKAKKK